MRDSDVISAQFSPGFSSDLTSWELFIARDRWLRQKVVIWNPDSVFHQRVLWFWAKLSRRRMAHLREIVTRIGFRDFRGRYTHQTMAVTDCPSYWITVRFEGQLKTVEAYDLRRLAEFERQPDMIGFRELWEALTADAPYGKVPLEEGLPRPWWRFW